MPRDKDGNINWTAVALFFYSFFLTAIMGLGSYAYTNDITYIKEVITEIKANQEARIKELNEKLDKFDARLRDAEIKLGGS